MKVVHGARSEDTEVYVPESQDFKTCPVCGATCFADMEVCFGCLHQFSTDEPQNPSLTAALSANDKHLAQIELDTDTDPANTIRSLDVTSQEEAKETIALPFDHTQDITRLKKPAERRSITPEEHNAKMAQDAMTSRHICSDGKGQRFEISITVKLL